MLIKQGGKAVIGVRSKHNGSTQSFQTSLGDLGKLPGGIDI